MNSELFSTKIFAHLGINSNFHTYYQVFLSDLSWKVQNNKSFIFLISHKHRWIKSKLLFYDRKLFSNLKSRGSQKGILSWVNSFFSFKIPYTLIWMRKRILILYTLFSRSFGNKLWFMNWIDLLLRLLPSLAFPHSSLFLSSN